MFFLAASINLLPSPMGPSDWIREGCMVGPWSHFQNFRVFSALETRRNCVHFRGFGEIGVVNRNRVRVQDWHAKNWPYFGKKLGRKFGPPFE